MINRPFFSLIFCTIYLFYWSTPQMIQRRQNTYWHLMELKRGFIYLKPTYWKKELLILWLMDVKVFSTQHLHFITLSLIHRFVLHHFFRFIVNMLSKLLLLAFCLTIHLAVMGVATKLLSSSRNPPKTDYQTLNLNL